MNVKLIRHQSQQVRTREMPTLARQSDSLTIAKIGQPDVVQMTSVHSPFDTRIFMKISRSLAKDGHRVLLVAPHDKNEIVDNVSIKGIARSPNRFSRMFSTSWRVTREALASGAKICHFHDPELMPAGLILKLRGRKVIYDVHEDYTKTIPTKNWLPPAVRKPLAFAIQALEWITALCVDRVFAATPTIAQRFPSQKTVVLQNFPIQDEFVSGNEEQPYSARPPIVTYIGGLTPERGSLEMVQAIGLVDKSFNASLHLAGRIVPDSLRNAMTQTPGWDRVTAFGFCDRMKVSAILSQSRIGLVVLHPHPNYINSLATKMFEYMSAGLPIIASDFPLWRSIIEDAGAGLLVDPMKPEEIAHAIEWLLAHPDEAEEMGAQGKKVARTKYSWSSEEEKLLTAYRELAG